MIIALLGHSAPSYVWAATVHHIKSSPSTGDEYWYGAASALNTRRVNAHCVTRSAARDSFPLNVSWQQLHHLDTVCQPAAAAARESLMDQSGRSHSANFLGYFDKGCAVIGGQVFSLDDMLVQGKSDHTAAAHGSRK